MDKYQILYNSAEVRKTIIEIFSTSRKRRVAITAFVGKGSDAYLPRPKSIELVCWPKAGGTNPFALRKLIKHGVKVSFADSLHMKVYWTQDKGAVITSANLSTNALGSGDLSEIGAFIPTGQLDIDKVLHSLKRREVSGPELKRLDKLHYEYAKLTKVNLSRKSKTSFIEWYESPYRSEWKLGWWDGDSDFSSQDKKLAQEDYGVSSPYGFMECVKGDYAKNDWFLSFFLKNGSIRSLKWMFVDFVARVSRTDKVYERDYPYHAVQLWSLAHYTAPPFHLDRKFTNAFKKALLDFGPEKFKNLTSVKPAKWLLESIRANY